jgi:two-component system CheB/CheR fusion protein
MSSVVDSLPEHIAVVDREGSIVAVNDAWKRYARENGEAAERCNEGVNYLTVCREA